MSKRYFSEMLLVDEFPYLVVNQSWDDSTYGPFRSRESADKWARANLVTPGGDLEFEIVELRFPVAACVTKPTGSWTQR